jgi:hypothetical protein
MSHGGCGGGWSRCANSPRAILWQVELTTSLVCALGVPSILKNETAIFSHLSFSIPGAAAELHG